MNAERKLFLSLWAVLILVFALWRFWPAAPADSGGSIPVELAPELQSWFQDPRLQADPSRYRVELMLTPSFAKSVQSSRQLLIGYGLRGPNGMLFQNAVPCALEPGQSSARLELPNPKRISARSLYLYLAR